LLELPDLQRRLGLLELPLLSWCSVLGVLLLPLPLSLPPPL